MEVTLVHYSLFGDTERIGDRFKYNSTRLENFNYKNRKIVIIARRFYSDDRSLDKVKRFVEKNEHNILGVILVDDKNYGTKYCNFLDVFSSMKVTILGTLDQLVSDEEIKHLEAVIDEKI